VNSKLPRELWIATLTCTVLGAATDVEPVVGGSVWWAVICLNGSLFRANCDLVFCLRPFVLPLPPEGWRPTNLRAFRVNLSWCVSGQPWRMQEVDDPVTILIGREEVVLGGLGTMEAAQCRIDHRDSSVGKNLVTSLHTRVFLSPQKVVQAVQTLTFFKEIS
jgi:hypothetical protein